MVFSKYGQQMAALPTTIIAVGNCIRRNRPMPDMDISVKSIQIITFKDAAYAIILYIYVHRFIFIRVIFVYVSKYLSTKLLKKKKKVKDFPFFLLGVQCI